GEQPVTVAHEPTDGPAVRRPPGFLWLRGREVVVARWVYLDLDNGWFPFYLFAAPAPDHVVRLRHDLGRIRRTASRGKWQVYNGHCWADASEPRRADDDWGGLVLDAKVRQRLEAEVIGFFYEPVAKLYRELDIPYRRGLLLYG